MRQPEAPTVAEQHFQPPIPPKINLTIAFCIDNMQIGGTELNTLRTAKLLKQAGVDLSVFTLSDHGPLLDQYAALKIPVDLLPIDSLYSLRAFHAGRKMLEIIKRRGISVVHTHDFYSNIFVATWSLFTRVSFIASRRWWEGPSRRLQRWSNRLSYVIADHIVANSPSVAAMLTRVEHVPSRKVTVTPNILDDESLLQPPPGWAEKMALELGLPEERLVVGVVANLSAVKDHATLLKAIALLTPRWPTLYAVLVGRDAGMKTSLMQLTESLGIADRVRFAGYLPNSPSPHHFFDVSALTSVSEGLPNSLLEAMAAGRPIVATKVGGVPDIVINGSTGVLVPSASVELTAKAIESLLSDPDMRRRYGQEARVQAAANYSTFQSCTQLIELYRQLSTRQ